MQTLETPPYEAICSISLNPLDTRKPRVRKTKNSMCFCCGTRLRLSDHHLKPRSEGGTDHPDNLVTVCYDCHDEIEGPADGAWERVVEFKNKIKSGRIAKTKEQRALDLREGKIREAEYEKTLRDNKNKILQAMGVLQAEPVVVAGLPESRILQVCIFSTLHKNQKRLKFRELFSDVAVIADEVDSQLKQQVRLFWLKRTLRLGRPSRGVLRP